MRDEVAAAVNSYMLAMVFGDAERLRSVLHPRFFCIGHGGGGQAWDGRDSFIAGCVKNAAAPGTSFFSEIRAIDITGDAASAKSGNDYLGDCYTDPLTLLRHDGEWVIVNRVFHQHPGK